MLRVWQWHRDCPLPASSSPSASLRAHLTSDHVSLSALDCSSLRLCRAEALVALGQHPQALEDLEAVCRAEPGEHEVREGWSHILLFRSSFLLS